MRIGAEEVVGWRERRRMCLGDDIWSGIQDGDVDIGVGNEKWFGKSF